MSRGYPVSASSPAGSPQGPPGDGEEGHQDGDFSQERGPGAQLRCCRTPSSPVTCACPWSPQGARAALPSPVGRERLAGCGANPTHCQPRAGAGQRSVVRD